VLDDGIYLVIEADHVSRFLDILPHGLPRMQPSPKIHAFAATVLQLHTVHGSDSLEDASPGRMILAPPPKPRTVRYDRTDGYHIVAVDDLGIDVQLVPKLVFPTRLQLPTML